MGVEQIFELLIGQGTGFALAALFFHMSNQNRAEATLERERYIKMLETQNEEMRQEQQDDNERPTRIVRPKKSYV